MFRRLLSILVLFLCLFSALLAQQQHGGKPIDFPALKSATTIPFHTLSTIDTDSLVQARSIDRDSTSGFKDREYGINRTININPETAGVWSELPCGGSVWRIGIESPNAKSLSLFFDQFALHRGAFLFIYDPDKHTILGSFTHRNNHSSGQFRTAEIPGEKVIIELQVAKNTSDYGRLSLESIGHAYLDLFKSTAALKTSGACNIDINCPEGAAWQKEKRSVVKYTYKINSSNYHCSGALVNNTRNNGNPYLLTARHCIHNDTRANSAVFYFNYEKDVCNGILYNTNQTLFGSSVLSTTSGLDYSLLRLDNVVPVSYDPYFSGYNAFENAPQSSVCIHHPRGDAKKISMDYDPAVSYTANIDGIQFNAFSHWHILEWDKGTTEGGSSGSPQYDQDHYIVGTLSGGDANCTNPVNDYFSKVASAWNTGTSPSTRLKDWLDPTDNNIRKHEGWDPMLAPCDTINKYPDSINLQALTLLSPDSGYATGHNSRLHSMYAEYFPTDYSLSINGVNLYMGDINPGSPLDIVTIKVWKAEDSLPGQVLFEKDVFINELTPYAMNSIDFDDFIPILSDFFVGYEIYYDQSDSFNVLVIAHHDSLSNSGYLFDPYDSNWHSFYNYYAMSVSLAMEIIKCYWAPDVSIQTPFERKKTNCSFTMHPNPASMQLNISIADDWETMADINGKIINLSGLVLETFSVTNKEITTIDISTLPAGLYLLQLHHQKGICTERFIILR